MASYPVEPWDLHGHAYVGVWLLPAGAAPPPASAVTRSVHLFGRTIVSAAFFRYDQPSPLTYDEIMSTVLVRHGWRPRVSITHIWVDSEASRVGGRALWAIPKDLAEFHRQSHRSYTAAGIGSLGVQNARRLPFPVPLGFRLAQDRHGGLVVSPVRGRVRLGLAHGSWSFDPAGPLGFLAHRRPVVTLALRPFHLTFGHRATP
ncbi:acetoacetate decarboxylase family protein [Aeromicrobium sp. CF3.5]|uniref:acetoacetate decarboxylase family protein n=1 Tax=Aeromicrobium sp. CF3.5 TaxID=3373078 RepID=UPI003EE5EE0C